MQKLKLDHSSFDSLTEDVGVFSLYVLASLDWFLCSSHLLDPDHRWRKAVIRCQRAFPWHPSQSPTLCHLHHQGRGRGTLRGSPQTPQSHCVLKTVKFSVTQKKVLDENVRYVIVPSDTLSAGATRTFFFLGRDPDNVRLVGGATGRKTSHNVKNT